MLKLGDTITVTLIGEYRLSATFDIGSVITNQPMTEVTSGEYVGAYTIKSGDDVVGATVVGRLVDAADNKSQMNAANLVSIDATPPFITSVAHDATTFLETDDLVNVTIIGRPEIPPLSTLEIELQINR